MRKPIIAGNWKMFKTQTEAKELTKGILKSFNEVKNLEIVIIPNFTCLSIVKDLIKNSAIKLGAQNMHWEKQGAYTGETSPAMLIDIGCEYIIIGHSERRQYFGETNETVNKKIKSANNVGLISIFCVGENLSERETCNHEAVVNKQLEIGLDGITKEQFNNIAIAYEPVWAIGTGKTATPEIANLMHKFIRNKIKNLYSQDIAEKTRILYGGSVKPENISSLMQESDIDGALVGGASLDANSFASIALSIQR